MRAKCCVWSVVALVLGIAPGLAWADHFEVSLTISDGSTKQSAQTETEPPKAREVAVRPMMQTTLGTRCTATWKVTSQNKETLKDVLVHFYVVRISKPGQAPPPLEPRDVVIETGQTMDFANKTKTSAELQFIPDHPGLYLIRVETQGTAEAKQHEHYAAMELTVK